MPFGFPSGLQLWKELAAPDLDGGLTGVHDTLIRNGHPATDVREFARALLLSGRASVDAFLEHRPEFLPIGKAAIAAALIPYEVPFALFRRSQGLSLYDYLWSKMNATPRDFARNRVAFITFNYDRSLEQYLSSALSNSYDISNSESSALLETFPIIHLHGILGQHPAYARAAYREYEPVLSREALDLAASAIRVIHEKVDDDLGFVNARLTLQQFDQVVFLGFGYDPTNLARLLVQEIPQRTARYGTAYDLTDQERRAIVDRFGGSIVLGQRDQTSVAFLRETVPLV